MRKNFQIILRKTFYCFFFSHREHRVFSGQLTAKNSCLIPFLLILHPSSFVPVQFTPEAYILL